MVLMSRTTADVPHTPPPNSGQKAAALPDTSGWLTREEGAQLLGVAPQTIKNYEQRGRLHPLRVPRRDGTGREHIVVVHDPHELAHLRETLSAETKRKITTDTSTWLTRNEATDSLSLSVQTLKNYEARGFLHPLHVPRRDARGHEQIVVVYDPKELIKLPRGAGKPFSPREPGELNARANEMFEQGRSIREVVIALRETSDKIREWHDKWLNDGGSDIVISPEAKHALETMIGPFNDVTDLVELVAAKLKARPGI